MNDTIKINLEFSPAIIDPRKDALQAIADEVAQIEADPKKMDKETLEVINVTKRKLVKARTALNKQFKELREPAQNFAKKVREYEKELIAIIEPQELRMKEIEKAAKTFALHEERKKTLPEFIDKLNSIDPNQPARWDENFLLDLDPNQRDAFYNKKLSEKLEADREVLRKKERESEILLAKEQERLRVEAEQEKKRLAEKDFRNWKDTFDQAVEFIYDPKTNTTKAVVVQGEYNHTVDNDSIAPAKNSV